jgi:ribonucleoside-diphosphate reductase subunit M1
MFVVKRNGKSEEINFDKVRRRIVTLVETPTPLVAVDAIKVSKKVIDGVYPGVHTVELDNLAMEVSAQLVTVHPEYGILASRLFVSSMHKEINLSFSSFVESVSTEFNPAFLDTVRKYSTVLDDSIIPDRDYDMSYFGLKTLEKSYLIKKNGTLVETPQYMFMRVAVAIHPTSIEKIIESYNLMSTKHFTHATPTLCNAGKIRQTLSSCFLTQVESDSIDGIFNTVKNCALISKASGGIGISVSNVRASGSSISGGGSSNGIVPMARVFNNVARYVDQGGNKRPGAFALYLEPWHADVFDFLELRKNHGKDEMRARDLFTALWIPDLFMRRVKEGAQWSLFCPMSAPGLDECWGEEFEKLYEKYENAGLRKKVIPAVQLWRAIVDSQVETGTPYVLYKDACNRTSNHNHLGTIKGSNLCVEIVEYFDKNEIAVCNLASIGLPSFVSSKSGFNYAKLHETVRVVTRNLDNVIDINTYPVEAARNSNMRHRPIGIGVQGLADVFIKMNIPFDCDEAQEINKRIFETLYHGALTESCILASEKGPYSSYPGSRISRGLFHFDDEKYTANKTWDWEALRNKISLHGVRNSLLVAPMPTASTSQILGFNECFEPYTSNMYNRRVRSGEFQVVNTLLVLALEKAGVWNEQTKNLILQNNGSVAQIPGVDDHTKKVFRTVWEIPQKSIINMAADRAPYIDQSQSMNIFLEEPTYQKISAMHFYGWEKGLKSGMYYLRTRPAARSIQFTVPIQQQLATSSPRPCEQGSHVRSHGQGPCSHAERVATSIQGSVRGSSSQESIDDVKVETTSSSWDVCYVGCESCSA